MIITYKYTGDGSTGVKFEKSFALITNYMRKRMYSFFWKTQIIIILTLLMLAATNLYDSVLEAGNMRIAVVYSQKAAQYEKAFEGFKQYLNEQGIHPDFSIYDLQGSKSTADSAFKEIKKSEADLIFSLGTFASNIAVESITDVPVIVGLVLRPDNFQKKKNATGVALEFPIETQLKMLRSFIPNARKIGVVYNQEQNGNLIRSAIKTAESMGLVLDAVEISSPSELPIALKQLSQKVDILWGINDSVVLNSKTAKNILLFSYRNHIPFIGLSTAWVKSGAIYSLDRDYTYLGIQCGEIAFKVLSGVNVNSIPISFPGKVIYAINLKTAEHMKINFKDEIVSNAHKVF